RTSMLADPKRVRLLAHIIRRYQREAPVPVDEAQRVRAVPGLDRAAVGGFSREDRLHDHEIFVYREDLSRLQHGLSRPDDKDCGQIEHRGDPQPVLLVEEHVVPLDRLGRRANHGEPNTFNPSMLLGTIHRARPSVPKNTWTTGSSSFAPSVRFER